MLRVGLKKFLISPGAGKCLLEPSGCGPAARSSEWSRLNRTRRYNAPASQRNRLLKALGSGPEGHLDQSAATGTWRRKMAGTHGWNRDRVVRHRSGQFLWDGQLPPADLQHRIQRRAGGRGRTVRLSVSVGPHYQERAHARNRGSGYRGNDRRSRACNMRCSTAPDA